MDEIQGVPHCAAQSVQGVYQDHVIGPDVIEQRPQPRPTPQRQRLLHRYLVWHLVRRLRSRNNGRPTSRQQALRIRNHARAASAFLDWLATHNLTLGSCTQADLDRWVTDDAGAYRFETGNFIRWARTNKLTSGHLASIRWGGPARLLDDQHRWDTARRLLHDAALKPEDRLAGLLSCSTPRARQRLAGADPHR